MGLKENNMKAILEFNLPEDQSEYRIATNASKYYSVLWDIQEHLFRKYKHVDPKSDAHYEEYEEIRTHLINLMQEHEVNLDE